MLPFLMFDGRNNHIHLATCVHRLAILHPHISPGNVDFRMASRKVLGHWSTPDLERSFFA